ncbi:MAG: Lrp/AsnC family transcriptional regulator [Rhodococcus sp. (in: high G+C Gram-positive bacteria)]
MDINSSKMSLTEPVSPNNVRAASLDRIDRVILRELARDARIPNNTLASRAGIAPSTCLGRVRSLVERGVIRGFHADIDPAALGQGLQAMIAVRLLAGARRHLGEFAQSISVHAEVLDVYFIAGADDYLIHVAMNDSTHLRDFVVQNLSAHPSVAATETILIFEHLRPRLPDAS